MNSSSGASSKVSASAERDVSDSSEGRLAENEARINSEKDVVAW